MHESAPGLKGYCATWCEADRPGNLFCVGGTPRALLYEYQNKGLTKPDCCKCMKTKGSMGGHPGMVLRLALATGDALERAPTTPCNSIGGRAKARPYNGLPQRTGPKVAW
jgi:hypothetical protein